MGMTTAGTPDYPRGGPPVKEAFALAAEHLKSSRRSVVRVVDLRRAKAIARGLVGYPAANVEAALLDDLGVRLGDPGVEIVWRAHVGQPGDSVARLTWCPGTMLPDRTLFVSCTASAPLAPSQE